MGRHRSHVAPDHSLGRAWGELRGHLNKGDAVVIIGREYLENGRRRKVRCHPEGERLQRGAVPEAAPLEEAGSRTRHDGHGQGCAADDPWASRPYHHPPPPTPTFRSRGPMDTATFLTFTILTTLILTALVLSAIDAYETRNRTRRDDRERISEPSLALMEARGERWAAHADAVAAEKAKEKAEAELVEAWRELSDHETDATMAAVIDLRERQRR